MSPPWTRFLCASEEFFNFRTLSVWQAQHKLGAIGEINSINFLDGPAGLYSLGNPSKDRQRFVDAVVLISAPDWSVKLSKFENLLETPFEFGLRMLSFAKLFTTCL